MAIHVWTMSPSEDGVLVHTKESWDGEPVRTQPEEMPQALDSSLRTWLQSLKQKRKPNPKVDGSGRWRSLRSGPSQRRALR
jgi:hypothetical protein